MQIFYDNGKVWAQISVSCQNGALDGEYRYWYENGNISTRRFYRKGDEDGESRSWSNNGQLSKHEFYRNGRLVCPHFTRTKKNGFLRMKRRIGRQSHFFSQYLISDLMRIVSNIK